MKALVFSSRGDIIAPGRAPDLCYRSWIPILACRPRVVECLLTLRRIYEVERNEGKRSPRRPFALSPRAGTPDVSGHQPLRLSQRHSSPFTPDVNYQAVQQVRPLCQQPPLAASIQEVLQPSIPHGYQLQCKTRGSQLTQPAHGKQAAVSTRSRTLVGPLCGVPHREHCSTRTT